jgi:hypothetical protein
MNRPNLHHQLSMSHSDTQSDVSILQHSSELHDDLSLETCLRTDRRFLALIPAELDDHALTHRLWELASRANMHIQLLSLCKNAAQAPSVRRRLVTIAFLLQNGRVSTEVKVGIGTNWLNLVKQNYQIGDVIVCFAEQYAGLLHRPLSQILRSNLHAPIYLLSGLCPQRHSPPNWLSEVAAWTGSICIIMSFGIIQAQVVQLPEGWFQNVLLLLSIIPEFWLIWVWDSRFG